jgi:hypothetical protein
MLYALEDRLVPSSISSITDRAGVTHFYSISASSHQLVEQVSPPGDDGTSRVQSASSGGPVIDGVSAGLDSQGNAIVYATTSADPWHPDIQVRTADGSWFDLGNLNYDGALQISGSQNGEVFAIGMYTGQVYVNHWNGTPGTWQNLGTPALSGGGGWQGIFQISAGTDAAGNDQVFGIGDEAGAIYVYDIGSGPGWQLVDSTTSFQKISATQDNKVFAIDNNGQLHQASSGWAYYSFGGAFGWYGGWHFHYHVWHDTPMAEFFSSTGAPTQFSDLSVGTDANGQDVVYAVSWYGVAVEYAAGSPPVQVETGVTQISAAGGGWFFDTIPYYFDQYGHYYPNMAAFHHGQNAEAVYGYYDPY